MCLREGREGGREARKGGGGGGGGRMGPVCPTQNACAALKGVLCADYIMFADPLELRILIE